jgi:hypothetical protein
MSYDKEYLNREAYEVNHYMYETIYKMKNGCKIKCSNTTGKCRTLNSYNCDSYFKNIKNEGNQVRHYMYHTIYKMKNGRKIKCSNATGKCKEI